MIHSLKNRPSAHLVAATKVSPFIPPPPSPRLGGGGGRRGVERK